MNKFANFFSAAILAVVAGACTYWLMSARTLEITEDVSVADDSPPMGSSNARIKVQRPRPADQGPHPKLAITGREHNFGTMAVNEKKSHTFVIRNEGEATLKMEPGTPTCKCTEFTIHKESLEPGEETEVYLEWVPKTESKKFRQHAPIFTNDPAHHPAPLKLVIEGEVLRYLGILPANVWELGTMKEDDVSVARGEVFSPLYDEFELINVKTSLDALVLKTEKFTAEELEQYSYKSGYKINAELNTNDAPIGKFEETISFNIDKDPEKQYTINVRGRRSGPVQIYPKGGVVWSKKNNTLYLSQFPAAEGKSVELIVFFASTRDFSAADTVIESVEVDPSFVECKIEPTENWSGKDRMRFDVKLTVPPNSPSGAWSKENPANIRVKTNHPTLREMNFGLHFISI